MIEREAVIQQLVAALERSHIAIDDWLNMYAEELCDPARVAEAVKRVVWQGGGTLAYISDIQAANRAALAAYKGESMTDKPVAHVEAWPNDRTPIGIVPLISMDQLPEGTKLYTHPAPLTVAERAVFEAAVVAHGARFALGKVPRPETPSLEAIWVAVDQLLAKGNEK